MSRLLIVSNRLPVTLTMQGAEATLTASSGGLATAMRGVHQDSDSVWVGSIGDTSRLPRAAAEAMRPELEARRLVSVGLSASDVALYYDGYSNGVLWPLFHYLLDNVRLDATNEWRAYRTVNQRFADAVAAKYHEGDTIWVHDYQLALVPGMIRRRLDGARIGFFLHVPWPASDVYRVLPQRREIVESLLACDVVGFHTEEYRQNFIDSAADVAGIDVGVDEVMWRDRRVQVGVYPIGIDVAHFSRQNEQIRESVERIRLGTPGKIRLLGLDRLDYTKGVPRRLLAIDRLLTREPQWRDLLHFIQLAVPTREKVEAYAELRRQVNELVGRINSQHGSATSVPVQFLYRSVDDDELLALYRAADVMIVTPLRDGMNLVAKEYVAAREADDGVLVLSEFAGAAAELDAAVMVNPYDVNAMATAIHRAIEMPEEERQVRMRRLREQVRSSPVEAWAQHFVGDLRRTTIPPQQPAFPPTALDAHIDAFGSAARRVLLLDYDGTLVPIAALPELAQPDRALLGLLRSLAATPGIELHVVSGRSRDVLARWVGDVPMWLHAEHGFWTRTPAGAWTAQKHDTAFREAALEIMLRYARLTPGSIVEPKDASVAFHLRGADPRLAAVRLLALRRELTAALGPQAELMDGVKVLEVRPTGVHKGCVVTSLSPAPAGTAAILAAGDDRTDEDMFVALPPDALTIRVGPGATRARFRVASPFELRRLLMRLARPVGAPVAQSGRASG